MSYKTLYGLIVLTVLLLCFSAVRFFGLTLNVSAATHTFTGANLTEDWSDADNWDLGVPGSGDDAVIEANITSNSGAPAVVNSFVFNDNNNGYYLYVNITATNGATFNQTSINNGTINGNAVFNDNSVNDFIGVINGNACFAPTATNNGTVTGTITICGADYTPPVISSIASTTNSSSATITWTTDEAASSTVNYGLSGSYGTTINNDTLTTSHSVTISGLSASTLYHFRVGGSDAMSNTSTSTNYTFLTAASSTSHAGGVPNPGAGGGGGIIYPPIESYSTSTPIETPPKDPEKPEELQEPQKPQEKVNIPVEVLPKYYFGYNLQYRDSGLEVQKLQEYLSEYGFFPVEANGIFGIVTYASLVGFQTKNNIEPPSGYFGPITRSYVNSTSEPIRAEE